MRFCNSTILASFTSSGASTAGAAGIAREGAGGFFPPVSHMMTTMRTARPARSQDCTFLGSNPGGFGALSWIGDGEVTSPSSLRGNLAGERQLLLADGEIARIDDLGHDVDAVLDLKSHEIGFPILDFIERRLFPSGAADVGERFVMVDRGNKERLPRGLCAELI